jgi:hypothetical protein
MALALDPEKHGMPTIDEWADSVFGPLPMSIGPGDPQLGLPDFEYNDGVDAADGPAAMAPGYGLDALEDAAGPGLLLRPLDGVPGGDGVDWADGPAPLPPAMFGRDLLQDVSLDAGADLLRWEDVAPLLDVQDVYERGDGGPALHVDVGRDGWAAAFAADGVDRAGAATAVMTPAIGQDLVSWTAQDAEDERAFYAPLSAGGAGDGVDWPAAA